MTQKYFSLSQIVKFKSKYKVKYDDDTDTIDKKLLDVENVKAQDIPEGWKET